MSAYQVPFFSQLEDIQKKVWQYRGCGIASLKMVLEYWHSRDQRYLSPSIDDLLATGLRIGAYREGIGWLHSGLVNITRQFGYDGFNRDYAPNSPTPLPMTEAWQKVVEDLQNGPLLASVFSGFDPDRGGGHIVVLTGVEGELAFYNDPEERTESEGCKVIATSAFQKAFKRRYICICPSL